MKPRGRTVIRWLAGVVALLATASASEAQLPAKVARVGVLMGSKATESEADRAALRQGLEELGWVEGRTIRLEYLYADGRSEQFPLFAAELVRLRPDVIVAASTPATQAVKDATRTVPIVFVVAGNPVETGLVPTLARPGGNVTGLSSAVDDQFSGKWVELLKEAVPRATRMAVLRNPDTPVSVAYARHMESAAQALGVRLRVVLVRSPGDLDRAFATMVREQAGAVLVDPTVFFSAHYRRVVELAARHRLPAMYARRQAVEAGGLLSYSANAADLWRRAASYVDRILKGARPGELPVEESSKFDLVINLGTARALGLTIPPSLLLRADHVIQ